MQVTIEITEEEYEQLGNHIKRTIMMNSMGFKALTIADKIVGRVYLAVTQSTDEEKVHE